MKPDYDIAVVGGGLAGLTLSIRLARSGHTVILFEKEQYPFHKVCGEYISLESWDYLQGLGLPLSEMNLPLINKLVITAPSGNALDAHLPLGGFGISRYKIDNDLKDLAIQNGVQLLENCKVEEITFDNVFTITTTRGQFTSKVCCGSFGKRSNIDVKWKRHFITSQRHKLNNYVGIKYHVESQMDPGIIALHNFKDGYCGISRIEDNKYCLCYLTHAANLKKGGSVEDMEKNILSANPHLKHIFENSKKLYAQPLTISQISFNKKTKVENHVLMIGDAAGMITPLCGNGMSMAIHAGKIAAQFIENFLSGKISRKEMEERYAAAWKKKFGSRLKAGRMIQRFFGRIWLSNVFISTMKRMPGLTRKIIALTHGKPF